VPCQNLRLEPSDLCLGIFDLVYDHLQHLTGNIRYTPVLLVHDNRNQSRHFVQALRLDKTELGQVPTQSIHQHGALADQQIPSSMHHERRLLLHRAARRTGTIQQLPLEQPDTSRRCFLEVGLKLAPNRLSGPAASSKHRGGQDEYRALKSYRHPAQVALVDVLRDIAGPSAAPAEMDASKKVAWESIASGKSINLLVGPPGVGKTYLISHLVKSILSQTPDARLLVSAQNHETLVQMEDELKKTLASG
jgi:Cdc6-like AAA superfamily ATPase